MLPPLSVSAPFGEFPADSELASDGAMETHRCFSKRKAETAHNSEFIIYNSRRLGPWPAHTPTLAPKPDDQTLLSRGLYVGKQNGLAHPGTN